MRPIPISLTIATSDSGGGAGIQADIKAMQANGTFAASVLVASTAQNTHAVTDIHPFPLSHIEAQLDAIAEDLFPDAIKTGMLFSTDIVMTVVRKIEQHALFPLVVDPVMISKSGATLLEDDAIEAVKTELIPLATLITPNAHEAGRLLGERLETLADAKEAARALYELGSEAVLVKGGHLSHETSTDVLFDGDQVHEFQAERIDSKHTHGTGCTYASAITAHLARGRSLPEAIAYAKRYVTEAIRHGLALGKGHGPTHHFFFMEPDAAQVQTLSSKE